METRALKDDSRIDVPLTDDDDGGLVRESGRKAVILDPGSLYEEQRRFRCRSFHSRLRLYSNLIPPSNHILIAPHATGLYLPARLKHEDLVHGRLSEDNP